MHHHVLYFLLTLMQVSHEIFFVEGIGSNGVAKALLEPRNKGTSFQREYVVRVCRGMACELPDGDE